MDLLWLREAYGKVRRDSTPGIDGQTVAEYGVNLEADRPSLLDRAKSGTYRAPPAKRVHLPKSPTETRPIALPTVENKVLERAVVMLLEPVYEQEFLDCSYGFRPGRSPHLALDALRGAVTRMGGGWVLDGDIRSYSFDAIPKSLLRPVLRQRIGDGVIDRLIGKWLEAGTWEAGEVTYPEAGTLQGSVISPTLRNVYLHEVLVRRMGRPGCQATRLDGVGRHATNPLSHKSSFWDGRHSTKNLDAACIQLLASHAKIVGWCYCLI